MILSLSVDQLSKVKKKTGARATAGLCGRRFLSLTQPYRPSSCDDDHRRCRKVLLAYSLLCVLTETHR